MVMRPETIGAFAFAIDAMERLQAGNTNADLICELDKSELQCALGLTLGMLWMANRLIAGFTGDTFEAAMQSFRDVVAAS